MAWPDNAPGAWTPQLPDHRVSAAPLEDERGDPGTGGRPGVARLSAWRAGGYVPPPVCPGPGVGRPGGVAGHRPLRVHAVRLPHPVLLRPRTGGGFVLRPLPVREPVGPPR